MNNMLYRRLDSSWDYTFGQGKSCYINGREACAQAIKSRLLLFKGEWWENILEGLPLWQSILGVMGAGNRKDVVDKIIQDRIAGTPHVISVLNISSSYSASSRTYKFSCKVNTDFGILIIKNTPAIPARTLTLTSQLPISSPRVLTTESGIIITTEDGNEILS